MKTKRILAAILSALMLMSCMSFTAGATEEPVDGEISLFDFLGEEGTAAIEEAEEAVDEPEEAVDEVEETVDEPEEAVDEVEETVEESEEPSEKSTKKRASKRVEAEEEASLMEEAVVEQTAVYLSDNGDDAKDGFTAENAVQTIGKALEIMNANANISTIVIVDAFHVTGNTTLGTSDKREITITGNNADASFHLIRTDYPDVTGDHKLTLSSPVVFENITLNGNHNDGGILAAGKTLTFGTGVTRYAGDYNFGMNVAAESGGENNFSLSSGSIRRLSLATRSGGSYKGVTNVEISDDATVETINLGHGWHTATQGFYGTANVVINGGKVSNIILGATGSTAAVNYSGLRYFTINDGVVGSIETTGSSLSGPASGYEPASVTVRDGVTVFEINEKGVVSGSISKGKNKDTKAYEEDDAIRIILFNNDSYEEGKVSDDGAIIVNVQNGALEAEVTVAADYTAKLDGYTFDTAMPKININGTSYETASLGNKIPADTLKEGYNLVIFDDIEISTVEWVVGETVTEQFVAVGSKLTPPAEVPNPTKEYYYTFNNWTINGEAVDIANYKVPAGEVTITASLTAYKMPLEVVKDFEKVYAMDSGKEFTYEKVTFEGVDGVKAIYSEDTSLHTKKLTFEGWESWPVNYSVTGKKNHINTGIYEYVAIKYYYVPGTNTTTRNIAMWIAGTNETPSTAMETNKWTYVVYELSKSGTSGQYHINMADGVNIGTLAANKEEFYIDTLTVYQNAPTVATITFKGEEGATLYAIDAINGEEVVFYSENGEQPKKDGYEFSGWAVEGTDKIVETYAFEEDTTLVPVFEEIVPTTANYTIETYTMDTAGVYGEPATETKNATVGEEVNCDAKEKTGFTVDTENSELGGTVTADGSLVLKVYYIRNQYKLYTKADAEAEAVEAGTYYYDAPVTAPAAPTKTGYTFEAWTPAVPATMPAENVTVTAQWTVNEYNVTFKNGETVLQTGKVAYGTMPEYKGATPTKAATAQYTYTFAGWTPTIATVTGDATYEATFTETVNEYTVTFKNGEEVLQSGKVAYGTMPEYKGATPTKAATAQYTYTFAGWTPTIATVTGDATYEATYTATKNSYTVTWKNGDAEVKTVTDVWGTAVTAPEAPAKTGYTFDGWDKTVSEIPTENVTVNAKWTINSYTITFITDGTAVAPITQDYATSVTAPTTAKTGYTFTGWSPAVPETMPAENIEVTAQWTANDVGYVLETYMMDKNGETYTLTATTIPAGNSGAITDSPFTYTPAAVEGFTLNTQKSVLTDTAVNADGTTLIELYYDRNVITIYYTVAGQTIEQVVKNEELIDEDHHFDVEIKLPVLSDEVLDEIYEHQHNGQSRKGYKFYWKKLDAVSGHLLEERNEALDKDVYYLPGDTFTVPSAPVEFTAYWDYSGAELKLVPNASKAVANDHEFVFDIYLESAYEETVTEFESGEFTLDITTKDNTSYTYELTPNDNITFEPDLDGRILVKRTDGEAEYLVPEENGTSYRILLGSIKVTGAGEGTVTLSKAVGHRHVVDGTDADHLAVEFLVKDATESYTVEVPTATLKVTVDFKNIVTDNVHEYQDMTMTISGGDLGEEIVIDLGKNASFAVPDLANRDGEAITAPALADGKYVVTLTNILAVNRTYTVKLEGAGYRSTRYTVSMTADKELYFWNNVMDNVTEIEAGKPGTQVTYLAGDIVKDSEINIYDLSAVVSYFGEIDLNKAGTQSAYTKYDLNRDGKIDSKDVAYVLVSWGK